MTSRRKDGADSRYVRWLYSQLPGLVTDGALSEESAERLRSYYGTVDKNRSRRLAMTVCSILGALLIGLGIILLLAHNWEGIARPVRVVLALVPLIVAQVLVGWTILRRKGSAPWSEGTATFLTLAVAASISLVGQTYHLPGDPTSFLLSWMLLSVPLVYLLRATVPALIYLVGITVWAGQAESEGVQPMFFWPLAAVVVPHFWQRVKESPYGNRTEALSWVVSICLPIAVGFTLSDVLWDGPSPALPIVVYSSLFTVFYRVGSAGLRFGRQPVRWQRSFQITGVAGIMVFAFMFSFRDLWRAGGGHLGPSWEQLWEPALIPHCVLTAAIPLCALWLLITCARRGETAKLLLGATPVLAVVGCSVIGFGGSTLFPTILFNAYILALGIVTVLGGTRAGSIGRVNAGMLVLIALLVARFFDSEMGFVARGIAFIVLGIGFLSTNVVLIRRRGEG